jgi:hypothetical protein
MNEISVIWYYYLDTLIFEQSLIELNFPFMRYNSKLTFIGVCITSDNEVVKEVDTWLLILVRYEWEF